MEYSHIVHGTVYAMCVCVRLSHMHRHTHISQYHRPLTLLLFRNIIIKMDVSNYKHLLMKHFVRIQHQNWLSALQPESQFSLPSSSHIVTGYACEPEHIYIRRLNNNCIPCLRTITINLNL